MSITADQERKLNEKVQSLTEKLLETFEELNLVYQLSDTFSGTSSAEQVIEDLNKLAVDRLEADSGWVTIKDERTGRLDTVTAQGVPMEAADAIGALLVGPAIENAKPVLLNDLAQSAAAHNHADLHPFLAVPLSIRETTIGAICLARRSPEMIFTAGDQKMLTVMASQGAMAIAKHKLEKKLLDVERLAAIGEFAARVAHEVRNPLTSIKGFTFLIGRPKTTPDQVKQYTQLIIEEIDRLDTIIKDILHFSRQSVLHPKEVSIEEVVDRALMLSEVQRTDASVELVRKNGSSEVRLMVDPERMLQVFLNLVINAIHAMEGGGKLTIESCATDGEVVVNIIDTGCGIPPENMEQIFDPFFTTKETGTGLGLAIVRRIVQEHGGDITAESTVGTGTKFAVRIPRHSEMQSFQPRQNEDSEATPEAWPGFTGR